MPGAVAYGAVPHVVEESGLASFAVDTQPKLGPAVGTDGSLVPDVFTTVLSGIDRLQEVAEGSGGTLFCFRMLEQGAALTIMRLFFDDLCRIAGVGASKRHQPTRWRLAWPAILETRVLHSLRQIISSCRSMADDAGGQGG